MPAGRPTTYTLDTTNLICQQLAQGISLNSICKSEEMPALSTVYLWMTTHPEFSEKYEKAKYESADALAEQIHSIADDESIDVQRAKLMIDTRKWTASKLKAKKYGDRVEQNINHSGTITTLTDDQLDAKLLSLINDK